MHSRRWPTGSPPDVPRFLFRRDVTIAGGTAIAVAVGFGLVQVAESILELV